MNYENLVELACERIECLTDQAAAHQNAGSELDKIVCMAEARELAEVLDSNDDQVLYMTYHRYLSENWGVEFEIDHGDEELMFGGI